MREQPGLSLGILGAGLLALGLAASCGGTVTRGNESVTSTRPDAAPERTEAGVRSDANTLRVDANGPAIEAADAATWDGAAAPADARFDSLPSGAIATCEDEACLCAALEACSPAERIRSVARGRVGRRICGLRAGRCVTVSFAAMGDALVTHCELPFGASCGSSAAQDLTLCERFFCPGERCPGDQEDDWLACP